MKHVSMKLTYLHTLHEMNRISKECESGVRDFKSFLGYARYLLDASEHSELEAASSEGGEKKSTTKTPEFLCARK